MWIALAIVAVLFAGACIGFRIGTQWERSQQMAMDALMSLPEPALGRRIIWLDEPQGGNDEKPTLH